MANSHHAAGVERDHIRGQTPLFCHHQVGLGQSKSTPAETGTASGLLQQDMGSVRAVVDTGNSILKYRPALAGTELDRVVRNGDCVFRPVTYLFGRIFHQLSWL